MDDWNTVTKIGSKVSRPGQTQRETTIKGKSALNAAQRTGAIISTEKKYASANTTSNPEGQRLTKVDRADGPVATKKVPENVAAAAVRARNLMKNQKGAPMTQTDLATLTSIPVQHIQAVERANSTYPPMDSVRKLQDKLNVKLTGVNIGDPMRGPKPAPDSTAGPSGKANARKPAAPATIKLVLQPNKGTAPARKVPAKLPTPSPKKDASPTADTTAEKDASPAADATAESETADQSDSADASAKTPAAESEPIVY